MGPILLRLGAVLMLCLLSACATLTEQECLNADWNIIGYEDGSRGERAAYITRHRQACAEHQISPDLESYQTGRQQGLKEFCQPRRGFDLGRRGAAYKDVCPAELEGDFLHGYDQGRALYDLKALIRRMHTVVDEKEHALEELQLEIADIENDLIDKRGQLDERRDLLREMKSLVREEGYLQAQIDDLEMEVAVQQDRLLHLRSTSDYR